MNNNPKAITAGDWLKGASKKLGKSPTASLDARLLLAHVLGWESEQVLTHLDTPLNPEQLKTLAGLHNLRRAGLPIAYILGYKDFGDFRVKVNKHVLIPRPATEAVLAAAIELAKLNNVKTIYEIGTGSGVLAIGLARALPDVKIIASDISPEAIEVAKQNISEAKLDDRIICSLGDLGKHIKHADMLVANLPYLPIGLKVSREVEQEPGIALWSGKDGLDHYKKLFAETSFDTAVIEFGEKQYQPLSKWLAHNLPGFRMEPITDLGGEICGGVISKLLG